MNPGDCLFLSASVPHRPGWFADAIEIEEAVVSLARAVFSRGGRLLFGGHPSISPLISSVAAEYFQPDPTRHARPVVTFQSRLYEKLLPDETWEMHRNGYTAIEWTPARGNREESLTKMRQAMIWGDGSALRERNQLSPPRAMVIIGGMEGCLEEAAIYFRQLRGVESPQPPRLHAMTSGGGAADLLLTPGQPWEKEVLKWVNPEDGIELKEARGREDLRDLEANWHAANSKFASPHPKFQPYASITQWFADEVI